MMIQVVLGNPHHPEYGVATIPFPMPHRLWKTHRPTLQSGTRVLSANWWRL